MAPTDLVLLVIGQVATSTILLVAAALMLHSTQELRRVPMGFEPEGVMTGKLRLPASRYASTEDISGFHHRLVERASAFPAVAAAATVDYLPLNHEVPLVETFAAGTPVAPGEGVQAIPLSVSDRYFSAMGVPLLRGRTFAEHDTAEGAPVAVISQPLAAALFGGSDVVDRSVVLRSRAGAERPYRIVGVAGGTRHRALKGAADAHVYLPQRQQPSRYLRLIVRGAAQPGQGAWIREAVRAVDSQLPVTEVRTMGAVVEEFLAPETSISNALTEQSITALLLALVGIYGVTAFSVARRRKEIGVRMALGASHQQIRRLVLGQGLRMGAVGVLLGLAGAYALTRFLSDFLFGVTAADPLVFGGVAALLLACSALACHLPARRASRVDPVHALRMEG